MKKVILLSIFVLCLGIPLAFGADIVKRPYEEFFRYHQFLRSDGKGWLATGESLSTADVKVYEKSTRTDTSSTMVSNVAIDSLTKVIYKLKGGESGKSYMIVFQVTTSGGQKFQDSLELLVNEP